MRLPGALVHKLYVAYASKEKQTKPCSLDDFNEILKKDYQFTYKTDKNRIIDRDYIISEIQPYMDKFEIPFEDKWLEKNKNHKMVYCKISDKLWQALESSCDISEVADTNFASFDKFIKELYARYQHMFIYNTALFPDPQPPKFGSQWTK